MRKLTRQEVWHHNSLGGAAHMAKANGQRVLKCPTTTDESRRLAESLIVAAEALIVSLKTRRDQENRR